MSIMVGSSPRARGTPPRPPVLRPRGRIIPAGAGNTASGGCSSAPLPDHPRGRGEHPRNPSDAAAAVGSSPRARGTHFRVSGDVGGGRIIPAGAGNTADPFCGLPPMPDHPRGRGEHSVLSISIAPHFGSSPRARGTQAKSAKYRAENRIIPAGAGNTCAMAARALSNWDHPRGRGEHPTRRWCPCTPSGSSPRARGTRPVAFEEVGALRIIPAGAGNTQTRVRGAPAPPDHPRGRGEHPNSRSQSAALLGSSPRARGTRHSEERQDQRLGIIPAGAGNTILSAKLTIATRDHPRGRGEHTRAGQVGPGARSDHPRGRGEHLGQKDGTPYKYGSSPRARGTRCGRGLEHGRRGIIPAGAGNTRTRRTSRPNRRDHPRGRGEHTC